MGIPYGDIAVSFLKSKLVLIGGGALVTAGVSTPIALTVTAADKTSGIISNAEFNSYFSTESLDKLIDESKNIQQSEKFKRGQQHLPSDQDRQTFLTIAKQISNNSSNNYSILSKEQRGVLATFLFLYAELEYSKTFKDKKFTDTFSVSMSSALVDGLSELKWNQEQIKFFKDDSASHDNKWGWKSWDNKNPFWIVYDQDQSKWSEKMTRLGSASSLNPEVSKEMEYDISSKILKEIIKIHKEYLK